MQDMVQHCLSPSLLERQRAHLQWQHQLQQQQQQQQESNSNFSLDNFLLCPIGMKGEDPAANFAASATPTSSATTASTSQVGRKEGSRKRKADKGPLVDEEKRMKSGSEGDNKQQKEKKNSDNGSKENSEKKTDYIHVRARRGQATDSHSLAERVRRERISERMKYLQGLVPGCNKITGKAGMLDEIINYVQSLQRQVEFLSMKLAAVNPRLDFNMEALFDKEMNLPCNSNISAVGMSPEVVDPTFLQFSALQQAVVSCGLDMAMTPAELALRRTMSTPVSLPEQFLDSCFDVQRSSAGWDNELHRLNNSVFPFQSLQGNLLPNNLKTEM